VFGAYRRRRCDPPAVTSGQVSARPAASLLVHHSSFGSSSTLSVRHQSAIGAGECYRQRPNTTSTSGRGSFRVLGARTYASNEPSLPHPSMTFTTTFAREWNRSCGTCVAEPPRWRSHAAIIAHVDDGKKFHGRVVCGFVCAHNRQRHRPAGVQRNLPLRHTVRHA
jgi:hypothetical protein